MIQYSRKYVNARLFRAINLVCAIFMIFLAVELILEIVA